MRGKQHCRQRLIQGKASTPAYAGQTNHAQTPRRQNDLYPRICGANLQEGSDFGRQLPLPPHMRGKLTKDRYALNLAPSTPAYAGQTSWSWRSLVVLPLYPRICGANVWRDDQVFGPCPLPPHMRGKPNLSPAGAGKRASTPAYAGQTLVEPRNSAEAYSPITRFSFTASPPASSGTRHTPSKTTGPATTSSKTTVR